VCRGVTTEYNLPTLCTVVNTETTETLKTKPKTKDSAPTGKEEDRFRSCRC